MVQCRDMVLYVVTQFASYRGWLGHDRGFPSRNRVAFLRFFIAIGALPVSRQCFILCRDDDG